MRIRIDDDRLNVFSHFKGSPHIENNTTRALMTAFSRTPAGMLFLRDFIDRIIRDVSSKTSDGEVAGMLARMRRPQTATLRMQQAIDSLGANEELGGVVVEIAPAKYHEEPSHPDEDETAPGGIADGCIVLEVDTPEEFDSDSGHVILLLESKLYARAGSKQIEQYAARFRRENKPCDRAHIEWRDLYEIAEGIAHSWPGDPVLEDFVAFLRRRPYLVPFAGVHASDRYDVFSIKSRLLQLCERISELSGAAPGAPFKVLGHIPKRGAVDADIDLRIGPSDERFMQGNLGVAYWGGNVVYTKLVVGAGRRSELDRARRNINRADVAEALNQITAFDNAEACVGLRLRFNRFEEERVELPSIVLAGSARESGWRSIGSHIETFHAREIDGTAVDEIREHLQIEERSGSQGWEAFIDARHREGKKGKVFAELLVTIGNDLDAFATLKPDGQVEQVEGQLAALADLLYEISA